MFGADAATERDLWRKHAAFAHTKKERRTAAAVRSAACLHLGRCIDELIPIHCVSYQRVAERVKGYPMASSGSFYFGGPAKSQDRKANELNSAK